MTAGSRTVTSKSFSSNPTVLEVFYAWLEGELNTLPFGKKDSNRVVLATAEAFSNALLHGNRRDPQKKVRVELILSGNGLLTLRVGDEGEGSQPHSARKSELFDTSGRGWELMHKLADGVRVRRENGFFWVELSFKMPKDYRGKPDKKGEKKGVGKIRSGGRR